MGAAKPACYAAGMLKNNKKNGRDGGEGPAKTGPAARIVGGLLGLLFGLCFIVAGLLIGLRPMGLMLYAAWEVRAWQPVPVEVLEASLEERPGSEGGTVHAVRTRYRYTYGGASYEGQRIGLDSGAGSDNLDDWHARWLERLQAARDGGPRLLAWVDPAKPQRAVLERQIRWRLLLVMAPFALVFPLVGMAALASCWRALGTQGGAAGDDTASSDPADAGGLSRLAASELRPRRGALFLWFFTLFWCGIAFPLAGIFLDSRAPIWLWLFCSLFVAVGLALLWGALRQSWRAWRYGGSRLHIRPARPRAGQPMALELQLSRRAAAAFQGRPTPHWRLSQYRVDESSSGSSEREVQGIEQPARQLDLGPAGLRLQASFEIPADAPPAGSQRSGERVDWRLSLRTPQGSVLLDYDVPVRAAEPDAARAQTRGEDAAMPQDRFARRTGPAKDEAIPAQPAPAEAPPLPAGVRWTEQRDAGLLEFAQKGWRWTGLLSLLLFGGLAMARRGDDLGLPSLLGLALLLALGLHGLTRRWTLQVRDDGLVLVRRSWLWRHRASLPASALDPLYHRLHHSRQHAGSQEDFHALYTRWPGMGRGTRLTPPLAGRAGAETLAQFLRWAAAQRCGRFSAGSVRGDAQPLQSRPAWGLALCLLLLWLLQRP